MFQHVRKLSDHSASLLLILLLSADVAFIVLHFNNLIFSSNLSLYSVLGSYGYLDMYLMVQLFWVIILFACILKITRCTGYVSWILVFTCLLIDEGLQLHQNIGDDLANSFSADPPHNLSLPPRYFELAVLAIAGMLLFAFVAWAYSHSPYVFRKISKDLLLFIVAWGIFGVITDLAAVFNPGPLARIGPDVVEDGGELVVVSLILWYVFRLAIRGGNPDLFLHDLLRKSLPRRRT